MMPTPEYITATFQTTPLVFFVVVAIACGVKVIKEKMFERNMAK